MKLLYIAYSCCPDRGSEDRIGWMIPLTAAKRHRVWVITKAEHRDAIEGYLAECPMPNLAVRYVDTPKWATLLFRGPSYPLRLNCWHRAALPLAAELCRREEIRIVHQITPVEFRSIGDYGSLPGVCFVCGPVGGGEEIPGVFRPWAGNPLPELARRSLNRLYRLRLQKRGIPDRCRCLLFANRETAGFLGYPDGLLYPETGTDPQQPGCPGAGPCRFLVAGRLIRRKGHRLLLEALASLPETLPWHCDIAGDGPQMAALKKQCAALGLSRRVTFHGRVPYAQMQALYSGSHVLVMPSLRETTGSVITEAMARGLPVVAQGRFGAAGLVSGETGWLYDTPEGLRAALARCIRDPGEVRRRGDRARLAAAQQLWDRKISVYETYYETILRQEEHP